MSEEMFKEALQSIKAGQRRRAKDLLQRLLKADPERVDYWVWMSAAVESEKEKIFCLQNALKLDPNSLAARRGLVVLGALKPEAAGLTPAVIPDDANIVLPEAASARGSTAALAGLPGPLGSFLSRPRNRELAVLAVLGSLAVALVLVVVWVIRNPSLLRRQPQAAVVPSSTPTRSPTATPTETAVPTSAAACDIPADPDAATPLAAYLCLSFTPTPVPVATEPSAPFESYTAIKRGYAAGEWQKILDNAADAVGNLPNSPWVYFYVAEAYRHTGNLAEAARNYNTATQKDDNFAPAHWGWAHVEFQQNRPDRALPHLTDAIAANPNFVPAYVDRAAYYLAASNYSAALADLEQARIIAPGNAVVLAHLALVYAQNDRPGDAAESAERALSIDPGLALGYYARGLALSGLGEFKQADRDLALAHLYLVDPDVPQRDLFRAAVLYHYGLNKVSLGDDQTALVLFAQALGDPPRSYPAVYVARGNILLRAGDYEAARADFNTAIGQFQRSAPNDPAINEAYLGNGLAFLGLGRPDSALSNFQIVVRNDPGSFEGQLGLGQAQLGTNRAAAALETFTAALALPAAEEAAAAARAYYWRALAYLALDRGPEAVEDLKRAAAGGESPLAATAAARLTEVGPLPTLTPAASATPTAGPSQTPTRIITATATTRP